MPVALDGQAGAVCHRLLGTWVGELLEEHVPAQGLCYLQVDQVRSVELIRCDSSSTAEALSRRSSTMAEASGTINRALAPPG